MKTKLSFLLIFLFCGNLMFSQSKQAVLQNIQKLLDKVNGEQISSASLVSSENKLIMQSITEQNFEIKTQDKKSNIVTVEIFRSVPWDEFADLEIKYSYDQISIVYVKFHENLNKEKSTGSKKKDQSASQQQYFPLYIFTSDKASLEKLFLQLHEYKVVKPTTDYKRNLLKLSKQQTINLLEKELSDRLKFEDKFVPRSVQIEEINDCSITIKYWDYTTFYKITFPTAIYFIDKYGGINFKKNVVKIIKEVDGTSSTTLSNTLGRPRIYDESDGKFDSYMKIEYALRHLSSFCTVNSSTKENTNSSQFEIYKGEFRDPFNTDKTFNALGIKPPFEGSCLKDMDKKADIFYYYILKDLVKEEKEWTKEEKTFNTIEGIAFRHSQNSIVDKEIFYNNYGKFCYNNQTITNKEYLEAVEELITQQYSRKKTQKEKAIVETWTKDKSRYEVRIQYDEGDETVSIALISVNYLKRFK